MPESSPSQPWTWPAGHALMLYHWSWFDPELGDVVVGWSRSSATDDRDYIHLEAERTAPARTVQVNREGDVIIEPHTFTVLARLPLELREDDSRPVPWIRDLLGQ